MIKKVLFTGAIAAAVVAIPSAAFADSCANVSRAPAPCGMSCSAPVVEGNWVWLPSIQVLVPDETLPPVWGFMPPGATDSVLFQAPGANGNYTNLQTESLLGMSAICNGGASVRQGSHGIQSGCA